MRTGREYCLKRTMKRYRELQFLTRARGIYHLHVDAGEVVSVAVVVQVRTAETHRRLVVGNHARSGGDDGSTRRRHLQRSRQRRVHSVRLRTHANRVLGVHAQSVDKGEVRMHRVVVLHRGSGNDRQRIRRSALHGVPGHADRRTRHQVQFQILRNVH